MQYPLILLLVPHRPPPPLAAFPIRPASIQVYAERFGGVGSVIKVLLEAAAKAESATGVGIGYILSPERHLSLEIAEAFARDVRASVLEHQATYAGVGPRVVGFGLHSDERGNPPGPFAPAFEIALDGTGLVSVPHAGELPPSPGEGANSVRVCVEQLAATRIGHGVLALEDPGLTAELARRKVCCDV